MKSSYPQPKDPVIIRYLRLMDAFAKSDDERDFYLDKIEGHLLYVNLDKEIEELDLLEKEILENKERYDLLPKLTFYEVKKFMEGFIHEKVYDIDTKEKLLDLISAREARENFLEFIYDHLQELEKWQLYYQERSRVRIIEWLRSLESPTPALRDKWFVFEEDLGMGRSIIEKLKRLHYDTKVPKDVQQGREVVMEKAISYFSPEATQNRPKRGRPPKAVVKVETEPQISMDIYIHFPPACAPFRYIPDIVTSASVTFSAKFENEDQLLATLRGAPRVRVDEKLEALSQRLDSLRMLSTRLAGSEKLFGGETTSRPFTPFFKPKFKETTAFEVIQEKNAPKVEEAIGEVLKKRGRPRKEATPEEEMPQRRRPIKRVTHLKSKKDK